MAATRNSILTLVRVAEDGTTSSISAFTGTTRPTFADLVKSEGMVAFQDKNGNYYEDMTATVDVDCVYIRDWTAQMINEHAELTARQYKIMRDDMSAMMADLSRSKLERSQIKRAIFVMDEYFETVIATALCARGAPVLAELMSVTDALGHDKAPVQPRPENEVENVDG